MLTCLLNPFPSATRSPHSPLLIFSSPSSPASPHPWDTTTVIIVSQATTSSLVLTILIVRLASSFQIQTCTSHSTKHLSTMAATASHQRHRNVIIIPIDVYRKYTESSSSDSSSMPARWPTSCGRASRDRKADTKLSTPPLTSLHLSRVKPQIQGSGKSKAKTRAHSLQRHQKASPSFRTTILQRNAETGPAYYTQQHHGHQDTPMKTHTNALSPLKPSEDDLMPFELLGKSNNSAVTIGGTIATINLHSLPTTSSRPVKRNISRTGDPPDSKRLKLRLNVKHSTPLPAPLVPRREHTAQPVIVISDSDDDTSEIHQSTVDMPTGPQALAVQESVVLKPTRQYRLEKHLRRIVDSIFPAHELGNQVTLERALATCSQLRQDYLIDRFLGSGSSGFVISAKRITDGKEARHISHCYCNSSFGCFPFPLNLLALQSITTLGCY